MNKDELLSVRAAAKLLGVERTQVQNMLAKGQVQGYKFPGDRQKYVSKEAIFQMFLEKRIMRAVGTMQELTEEYEKLTADINQALDILGVSEEELRGIAPFFSETLALVQKHIEQYMPIAEQQSAANMESGGIK